MADRPLLVWLRPDEPADAAGALLGGKADAVARLITLGQPVPRSAVLTTAAYGAATDTTPVRTLIHRLLTSDPGITDEEIDRTFLDAPLPDAVDRALDELAADLSGPVAVRSSATAEDLAAAAFAGQYRSVLDVEPNDLPRAVRLVWASLWHAAPRTYRRLRGLQDGAPAMAVLVMEMIEPETAGVLFTRDPVGDESNVRLETVVGQGAALVSGTVTPDAHVWPREDAALAAAGTVGPAVGELVERGLTLETAWGAPLDIEYAVDRHGRLWLVQARPITAIAATVTRPSTLTRAGIAEMLPGALPPLLQRTAARHVDEGFRNLLIDLGADLGRVLRDDDRFVRFDRSHALLDLALLRRATATVPGGSVAALDRGYDSGPATAEDVTARTTATQVARVLRRRRAAVVESEIVVQAVDRLVEDDGRRDGDDLADVLARWERVQDLGARATTAEMSVAALATAAFEGVQRTLTRHVGPDRARELTHQLTSQPRRHTGPLDRCIRASGVDPSRHLTEAEWSEVLARSGSRAVFGGPTWEEEPGLARMSYTAGRADAAPAGDAHPLASVRPPPGSARPPLSRVRRLFVRREAEDAAELLDRRERSKRALLDLGGVAYRLTVELGEALVRHGTLPSTDDVWLLTPAELRTACIRGTVPPGLAQRRCTLLEDLAMATVATMPTGEGQGWPASPGTARGRAVAIDVPRAGAIGPGDVLVARATDAGWAPLFAHAAAIVVEEGGPLSHAAIVARELGVPAVVNVPGIFERIIAAGAGTLIEVDGSTGRVTLVDGDVPLAPVITPPEAEPRLGVFVTGLIGASALFGVLVSISEAVSSARGIRRTRARAAIPAAVVAEVVRHGTGAARTASVGLAPARTYGRWAVAFLVAGLLLGAIGLAEYASDASDDRMLWLVTAVSTVPAALGGAHVAHRAAAEWPDVPPVVRRLTPNPQPHTTVRQGWSEVPLLHRRWLVAFASVAATLLLLNLLAPTALRAIDEPLYDAIGAPDPDPWAPEWFGMYFGRPQVAIPIALLVALFTVRCRVLAVAYPLTIMFGGLLNLGLGSLVGKSRPPLGAHADQTDSFPSGHAIEVTLLLGLLPLAVAVLVRSRWLGHLTRAIASGVLALMLVDGLREGSHWPTDHLGGFAIAMTAVVLVHALARTPSLHRSCTRCPAMALLPRARRAPHEPGDDP